MRCGVGTCPIAADAESVSDRTGIRAVATMTPPTNQPASSISHLRASGDRSTEV